MKNSSEKVETEKEKSLKTISATCNLLHSYYLKQLNNKCKNPIQMNKVIPELPDDMSATEQLT